MVPVISRIDRLLDCGDLPGVVDALASHARAAELGAGLWDDLRRARAGSDRPALAALLACAFLRLREDAAAALAFRQFDAGSMASQCAVFRPANPPGASLEVVDPPEEAAARFELSELCGRPLPRHRALLGSLEGGRVLGLSYIAVGASNLSYLEGFVHNPWRLAQKSGDEVDTVRLMSPQAMIACHAGVDDYDEGVLVGNHENFAHWLLNHVGRLFLKEALPQLDRVPVVVGENVSRKQEELLALLGYDGAGLVRLRRGKLARFRKLWLPGMPFCGRTADPNGPGSATFVYWSPETVHLLRRRLNVTGRGAGRRRRLFLTRQGARWRRLTKEAAVSGLLRERGFEFVDPAALSIREQLAIAGEAEMIAGAWGAAMGLLLFAPAGTTVIDLKYRVDAMDIYPHICPHLGQRYVPVVGEADGAGSDPLKHDFRIPLDRLAMAVPA